MRGFKYAAQRIRKGWCESDVWNLDLYLESIIIDTLRQLADVSHGYPGNDEFPTFESWQNWLRETADMIDNEDTLFSIKEAEAKRKEGLKRVFEHIDYLWD